MNLNKWAFRLAGVSFLLRGLYVFAMWVAYDKAPSAANQTIAVVAALILASMYCVNRAEEHKC